jgi:hypothetical protein
VERAACPTCPAATPIAGPPGRGPGVLCGVWFREMRDGKIEDAEAGVLLTLYNDPTSLHTFCCGEGVPGARNSYVDCPVWERECERRDDAERSLAQAETPDEGIFENTFFEDGEYEMPGAGYFV